MTKPETEIDCPFCPHCGAESKDDDDLCRFCGKLMVATVAMRRGCAQALKSGVCDLKRKIRPLNANELDELFDKTTFNLSNPADPIWDD